VIRNVVLHILNEQPMMADLFAPPSPADVTLVCTNLRLMNGKRPIFVDLVASTFVFPYAQLRFVEVPPAGGAGDEPPPAPASAVAATGGPGTGARPALDEELELDEDLLRRVREL
jgi:hypothetical protein